MKPLVYFDGVPIANYCRTMQYIKAGWAGPAWDRCRTYETCQCCTGDPEADFAEEWWYDPRNPCSMQFYGILVDDVVYGESYERAVTSTFIGGRIGPRKALARDITITGFIVASTEGGTEFGLDALNALLAQQAGCFGPSCNTATLTVQAFTSRCDPAIDACVQTEYASLSGTYAGDENVNIVCTDAAGNLFPYYGTKEEKLYQLAQTNCCAACDATRIFKRVAPRGPVQEVSSSLRRGSGTRFTVTLVAEVPYKFRPAYTAAADLELSTLSFPNWCCKTQSNDNPCAITATGELATGLIPSQSATHRACFCSPVFAQGVAAEVYGHKLFETVVNWQITNTGPAVDNLVVEAWPSNGFDPFLNPHQYVGVEPARAEIFRVPEGGSITYDGAAHRFTVLDINSYELPAPYYANGDPMLMSCGVFWVSLKSDSRNEANNANVRFTVSGQHGVV